MLKIKKLKSNSFAVLLLVLVLLFSACSTDTGSKNAPQTAKTLTATVTKNSKYDSANLSLTAEDFKDAGFSFGDSFNVAFSNGYSIEDVPYYNGYYVKTGFPVIVSYPTSNYVLIANNSRDFWTPAKLEDGDTAEITLNTAGKYLATFEALGQSYSVDRNDYESDEAFANFRAMSGGNLKENFIFRGASPVNNSRNRAAVANNLLERAGIKCVIDLADSKEEINEYFAAEDFNSEYTKSLYEQGYDITLAMSANYDTDAYKASVAKGMRHLLKYGGPAYIHCTEGKDRTGFVCLLLEALVGASYDEMCADYMKTYENYYKISKDETPESYDAVVFLYFDSFIEYLTGVSDESELKTADYVEGAKQYLTDCGMTKKEIKKLISLLSK